MNVEWHGWLVFVLVAHIHGKWLGIQAHTGEHVSILPWIRVALFGFYTFGIDAISCELKSSCCNKAEKSVRIRNIIHNALYGHHSKFHCIAKDILKQSVKKVSFSKHILDTCVSEIFFLLLSPIL